MGCPMSVVEHAFDFSKQDLYHCDWLFVAKGGNRNLKQVRLRGEMGFGSPAIENALRASVVELGDDLVFNLLYVEARLAVMQQIPELLGDYLLEWEPTGAQQPVEDSRV